MRFAAPAEATWWLRCSEAWRLSGLKTKKRFESFCLVPQERPKSSQEGRRVAQKRSRAAKSAPRAAREQPRAPQECHKSGHEHPRSAPRAAKSGQKCPRSTPRAAKSSPRAPKSTPRAPQERPRAKMLIFHWFYNGFEAQLPRGGRQRASGPEPWRG